jgi:hypothetical protein
LHYLLAMAKKDRTASLMSPNKLAQVVPKARTSPAAWLDQMAADAGHIHVKRLVDLCKSLQAQLLAGETSDLLAQLSGFSRQLPSLDFGLVRDQGWWARTTGKSRVAGEQFAAQFAEIDQLADHLQALTQSQQRRTREQADAVDRLLLEIDSELKAIDKINDEGTRWLQDMRSQLRTRQAAEQDEHGRKQVDDDTARCEILVERLKTLRDMRMASQRSRELAKDLASRRSAVLQLLQEALASDVKVWHSSISSLTSKSAEAATASSGLEEAMESHRELQLCMKQVLFDCSELQQQEQGMVNSEGVP